MNQGQNRDVKLVHFSQSHPTHHQQQQQQPQNTQTVWNMTCSEVFCIIDILNC